MKYLLAIALSITLFACGNNAEPRKDGFTKAPKTKEDSIYDDVLAGHDVAMAKMGKLKGCLQLTKHALDSLAKLPDTKEKLAYKQTVLNVQESLNYADSSMDSWMQNFNVDSFENDVPKRIDYLESERNKVNNVKGLILGSLNKADSLFK